MAHKCMIKIKHKMASTAMLQTMDKSFWTFKIFR